MKLFESMSNHRPSNCDVTVLLSFLLSLLLSFIQILTNAK